MGRQKRRKHSNTQRQSEKPVVLNYVKNTRTLYRYDDKKAEIVELIGKYLDQEDLLICREVCKLWEQHITQGVDIVEALVKAKEVVAMSPICIAKVLPHMQRMRLHLSGRADQHNFFLFCELCRPLKLIKELHVLLSSADAPPMQITFDINWLGFACFSKLQSLIITGRWEGTPTNISILSALTSLTKLVLQPQQSPLGVKSRREVWEKPGTGTMSKAGVTGDALKVLATLKQLQHLDLWLNARAEPQVVVVAELTKLTSLALRNCYLGLISVQAVAKLPFLEHLRMGMAADAMSSPGLKLPMALDCRELVRATQITSLQLHLRDRDLAASGPFHGITRLQALDALHLDTCTGLDQAGDIISQLTKLTALELSNVITGDSAPWEALRQLRNLRELMLHNFRDAQKGPRPGRNSTPRSPGYLWRDMEQLRLLSVTGTMHRDLLERSSVAYALWNAAELRGLHCEFPVALEHGVEVGGLSASLEELHLANCWTVWRLGAGQRGVEGRLDTLRCLTLEGVCLLVLPAGVAPRALASPRDSRALRDALVEQLSTAPSLAPIKQSPQVAQMLALLPADLRELRLLSVQQLSDRDMAAVARFTRLRELAVHSIGNHQVSHAALKVGDMFELIPHPPTLAKLSRLQVLGLTWSLYHQMSRWSALAILDSLPYCQVSVK